MTPQCLKLRTFSKYSLLVGGEICQFTPAISHNSPPHIEWRLLAVFYVHWLQLSGCVICVNWPRNAKRNLPSGQSEHAIMLMVDKLTLLTTLSSWREIDLDTIPCGEDVIVCRWWWRCAVVGGRFPSTVFVTVVEVVVYSPLTHYKLNCAFAGVCECCKSEITIPRIQNVLRRYAGW